MSSDGTTVVFNQCAFKYARQCDKWQRDVILKPSICLLSELHGSLRESLSLSLLWEKLGVRRTARWMYNESMNIFGLGAPELILIAFVLLLFFGKKRLPGLVQSIGQSVKELRDGLTRGFDDSDKSDKGAKGRK